MIIGLDGAGWDVFDNHLLQNHMPNLNRLKKKGCSGILRSTYPPITPAAWTTCITGCQPYTHGVVGFSDYSFEINSLRISTSASCRVPTMWEQLSEQGYSVACINVPWTYPCRKVNGVMVAGYGVPGTDVEFTYPAEFGDELLAKVPDYKILADWQQAKEYSDDLLDKNICEIEKRFGQRIKAARLAVEKVAPDIMMVQFQNTDLLQHFAYGFVDRRTRDKYPKHRDRIFKMFEKLDDSIGKLLKMVDPVGSNVIVVSDHGLCKRRGKIRPNVLLRKWGYLKPEPVLQRIARRLRQSFHKKKSSRNTKPSLEFKTSVNWETSRAMAYPALLGYIYLNVTGRNKSGCVHLGPEFDGIIEDLRNRFSQMTDPVSKGPLFECVKTPRELYGVENLNPELVGDLILVPREGYIINKIAARKTKAVKTFPADSIHGCHSYGGIYILGGRNIRQLAGKQKHIVDVAPTVMAMLGAEIPAYMDGRVLDEFFIKKPALTHKSASTKAPALDDREQGLSAQDEQRIAEKLSALGYLE